MDLEQLLSRLDVDLYGTAPVSAFDQAPPGFKPQDLLPTAQQVIVIARSLNPTPIRYLPKTRNQYMVEFEMANWHLTHAAYQLARQLQQLGHQALPISSEAAIGDYGRLKADFSLKHAAVLAGLGFFGLNNLILTPAYGPAQRWAAVITSAPYTPLQVANPARPDLCSQCQACVRQCPAGALQGWEGQYNPTTGWTINKEKCAHYIFVVNAGKRCGICIASCPLLPE
ncbi:4Fe-4S dicluster domain-containing protein [Carboxydocella sporoproducens DSM 16521]|uniref:4Fe-4S dicluster domain-containing protein n=2 Tax=Carboxydocella TaxID=178898 RepID=A0A1T4R8S1_9FIRM|nr:MULTISPECIES: 4Fe-4S dicluster domain-containing protein [Carboxydocella]AVX19719.1 4Fe-4S dicluster domain-containing protein [Carboxydocella thermautotrophica]AVX30130.1 4Fe-4S dicluster domain-containing protein [Carboxydocella thermautotrophica]SKA12325.1 4Fe-4S dicluster domain-containing protein [Carboxydocella sporoproducens DSM 16521]